MSDRQTQWVVFQPNAYLGLQRGINQIADVIRPTLGPLPRIVAVEQPLRHRSPELLDNGAVIARRIIQLPDRDQDMGAMLVRHVLHQVHQRVGDGTATAAVLFQAIYNQGVLYLAAGGNALRLRHYLEKGMQAVIARLVEMTAWPQSEEQLAQIASTICYDPPMAQLIGEIFGIIGEYGRIEVRIGQRRNMEREYIEGMYWDSGLLSREMITDRVHLRTEMENVAILMSDLKLDDAEQLVTVLSLAMQAGCQSLLVIAEEMSEKVSGFLRANSKPDQFSIAAVKAPGLGSIERGEALLDMVRLVGGQPFLASAGQKSFDGIGLEDLGRAQNAWADYHNFGIVGGKGDPRALRKHIADLRIACKNAQDVATRQKLQQRIGKLLSGSAILWVGGATNTEVMTQKELAQRTADAMRSAIVEGILPGGGVALLACCPVLQQRLETSADTDERAACHVLIEALTEPFRAIVANAGYDPAEVAARIAKAGSGYGLDVTSGRVVHMAQAGIFDAAAVLKTAVQSAVIGAALALTTDVLVHHKNQDLRLKPGTIEP